MIDWYSVGFNALWIAGLGLVTVGLSIANYLGGRENWRFRRAIRIPICRNMVVLGLVFFCFGLAGGVSNAWEHILWAALALIFILQTWLNRKTGNP
jgi:hypothetical protein